MATLEIWNGRVATQTDANSPLDFPLMDGLRKDMDHLRQVVYGDNEGSGTYYTPVWGHTHDGLNSKPITAPSIQSSGGESIPASSTWTPAQAMYNVIYDSPSNDIIMQLYVSGSWRSFGTTPSGWAIFADGTNVRALNQIAAARTLYFQNFSN